MRKGKRYVQTGEKILGNREKGIGLLVAAARPYILERAAESDFFLSHNKI
jgi:hypothetical protein